MFAYKLELRKCNSISSSSQGNFPSSMKSSSLRQVIINAQFFPEYETLSSSINLPEQWSITSGCSLEAIMKSIFAVVHLLTRITILSFAAT